MGSVARLSDEARTYLIAPRRGPGVCVDCFNLTRGYEHCYACTAAGGHLQAIVPISYSVAGERLHAALAAYKRDADPFVGRATAELAAILWRFLERHEPCIAEAAGVERFDLVTTVPSGDRARDERNQLRSIVAELVGPTHDRHERLLRRSTLDAPRRRIDVRRFEAVRPIAGSTVLLVDDTWTTGASAQSAAAALRAAGARSVAAVVIGRYLNPGWSDNRPRLQPLRGGFDFSSCALCAAQHVTLRAA